MERGFIVKKFFGKKTQLISISLYVLGLVLCCIINSSLITNAIVDAVGGASKDRWYLYLPRLCRAVALDFTVIFVLVYTYLTFETVHKYWYDNQKKLINLFHNKGIFNKRIGIICVLLFVVSLIGFYALLRANVSYIDDIRHNVSTHYEWGNNYGRWGTVFANLIIQMGYTLGDRSPINQIIAISSLVISAIILSIVMTNLFHKEKITTLSICASSIVVFNPYFLQCLSYKYDSVGMGISVLLAIFPFLALGDRKFFLWLSAISLFFMCIFYQGSSGFYIIMVIFAGFIGYNLDKKKKLKDIIIFYVESAIAFIGAMVAFYILVLPLAFNDPYAGHTTISLGMNLIYNLEVYLRCILYDFNFVWKLLTGFVVITSLVTMMIKTERSRAITFIYFMLVLIVATCFSYGAYLFLSDEGFADRARYLYCFVIMLAIIANISVMSEKVILNLPACLLAWSFFSYASAYGNALAYDRDYTNFMEKQVLGDVNEFFSSEEYPELQVVFSGDTNNLLPVEYLIDEYPITERMITGFLHYDGVPISSFWAVRHFIYYDNTLSPAETNYEPNPEDGKLIVSKRYYDLYFHQPDIIQVVFKKL